MSDRLYLFRDLDAKEPIGLPKRDDLEYKALHFIVNIGSQGVLQSNLWRKLGATSREGSRIALKLENKGLIKREKELSGGRWTYRLYPKRLPASMNSITECPCLMCPNDARCGAWGTISPNECERLTEWILGLTSREAGSSGES
ncbi:MAG: transcriptional regulator [Candidatus Bathyarchaeota archaeon]|nr:transcriptional regulator [Candidatus Bathyarchaeota archaeon]